MTRYRKLLIASSVGMAIGLTGCGGGGSSYDGPDTFLPPPPPPPPPVPPPPPPPECIPTTPWDYC